MKTTKTIMFLISCLIVLTSGCSYLARYDGPYKGRVIDAETGSPIEGVVVLGVWSKVAVTPVGGVSSYYDAQETVTNRNGEFEIRGLGIKIMSKVAPMDVLIFKAGYDHIGMGPWESLKLDGGALEKKVTWEGKKAIIPLRKLTMEERKKKGTPSFPAEAYREKKMSLLIKEINKEENEFGRPPYPER
jgi:hypothetical protein